MQTIRQKQIEGARLYAKADRSDPFAFSRAMSHINNGLCKAYIKDENRFQEAVLYNAKQAMEIHTLPPGHHFSDGSTEYQVTVYREVTRP